MTRVYAPADLDLLRAWHDAGIVGPGPERVVAGDDDEESEAAALAEAAADSARLAGATADDAPPARRVVVVAEVSGDPDGDVPWRDVVAVHADLGPETLDRVDARDDLPPWVATQEVARLLDGTL